MNATTLAQTPELFAEYLHELRLKRRLLKRGVEAGKVRRQALSKTQRLAILEKTGRRCHICGGAIDGKWHADHVLAHSGGGQHAADNYLPACALCNNYRWDYIAEEFQQILKLGVWVRTLVEKKTPLGLKVAQRFLAHEMRREGRQKRELRERREA